MINRHLVLHFNSQETNVQVFAIFSGVLKQRILGTLFLSARLKST